MEGRNQANGSEPLPCRLTGSMGPPTEKGALSNAIRDLARGAGPTRHHSWTTTGPPTCQVHHTRILGNTASTALRPFCPRITENMLGLGTACAQGSPQRRRLVQEKRRASRARYPRHEVLATHDTNRGRLVARFNPTRIAVKETAVFAGPACWLH